MGVYMGYGGKVLNNADKMPIAGVPVSDGRNIVFTDTDGCFELPGWERAHVINVGILTRSHNDWFFMIDGHDGDFTFSIDPEPVSCESFNFLHVSDTEIEGCGGTDWIEFMRSTVKKQKPAFVAHTGDLCRENGINRHYLVMNRETVGCPVRYAIGNHDFIGKKYGEESYERLYGPTWYSFDCGRIHFVVLSIGKGDKPSGYDISDQFAWLLNDLENMRPGQKLIVLDHDFCKWDPEGFSLPFFDGNINMREKGLLAWIYGHFHYNIAHDCDGVYNISSSRVDSAGIDSSAGGIRKIDVFEDKIRTEMLYDAPSPDIGDRYIWRTELNGYVGFSAPKELDGDIIIGTFDDGLPKKCGVYRLSGHDGAVKWFYQTKYGIHNDLASDGKLVFAQDEHGSVHCIDAESGAPVWERRLTLWKDSHTHSGALLAGELLICGSMFEVYALDKNGNEAWHTSLGLGEGTPSKFVYDEKRDRIIVSNHWRGLASLDRKTGEKIWENRSKPVWFRTTTPTVCGDIIYSSGDIHVIKLDAESGEFISDAIDVGCRTDVCGAPFVDGDTVYCPTARCGVLALDSRTLALKNVFPCGSAKIFTVPYEAGNIQTVESSPRVIGDTLIFAASDGAVYFYDKTTAWLKNKTEVGAPITADPIIGDGYMITADFFGRITKYAL